MIPKIIHQTWSSENVPENFKLLSDTWKAIHPDWEYRLWTDQANRQFISRYYPEFLNKYDDYPQEIQRIDAVRYFLLHKYGGVYVDLDFQCFRNISPLLEKHNFVLGKEPRPHAERFGKDLILCNAFMASSVKNEFLYTICSHLLNSVIDTTKNFMSVLESTGPFMLTDVFHEYAKKAEIEILESDVLYPLTMHEVREVTKGIEDKYFNEKLQKAYALHYFWGSW